MEFDKSQKPTAPIFRPKQNCENYFQQLEKSKTGILVGEDAGFGKCPYVNVGYAILHLKGPKSRFGLKGVTFEETLNENIGLKHEHTNTLHTEFYDPAKCGVSYWYGFRSPL